MRFFYSRGLWSQRSAHWRLQTTRMANMEVQKTKRWRFQLIHASPATTCAQGCLELWAVETLPTLGIQGHRIGSCNVRQPREISTSEQFRDLIAVVKNNV